MVQSSPGLLAIANLQQTVASSPGRFVSGVNTGFGIPFLTPALIYMNDDCNISSLRLKSFNENFWTTRSDGLVFGVIVGMRVLRDKSTQLIALEFNSRTGTAENLQIIGRSVYSIVEALKTQEEYKLLTLVNDVPDKYNLLAAKLLTENTQIMMGLQDPMQRAIAKVKDLEIDIESLKTSVGELMKVGRSNSVDMGKVAIVVNPIKTTCSLLEQRINVLEPLLNILMPQTTGKGTYQFLLQ